MKSTTLETSLTSKASRNLSNDVTTQASIRPSVQKIQVGHIVTINVFTIKPSVRKIGFLSLCLSVSLSFCLSVSLSFCLSVFLSFCLPVPNSPVSLSFHIYVLLSVCLYVCFYFPMSLSALYFFLPNYNMNEIINYVLITCLSSGRPIVCQALAFFNKCLSNKHP